MIEINDVPVHPVAAAFPPMSDDEFTALKASIQKVGQTDLVIVSTDNKWLIDGVHRRRACQELGVPCRWTYADSDASIVEQVVAKNLARRHLTPSQRALIAAELANMEAGDNQHTEGVRNQTPSVSQSDAAAVMGVPRQAVNQASKVKDSPVLAEAVRAGDVSVSDAAAIVKEPEDVQREAVERVKTAPKKTTVRKAAGSVKRERRREAAAEKVAVEPPPPNLIVSPISELAPLVHKGSVDAIVTDPPYTTEFVEQGIYRELAEFALHALRPGGLLLAILPHLHLERVLREVREAGLDYRWIVAYTQAAANQQVHAAKVTCMWKPWVAWKKPGGPSPEGYSNDWASAGPYTADDKHPHHWGQTSFGLERVIEEWVKSPDSLVCDPFCGAGSTLVAARSLGHRVLGADIDPANIQITKEALNGAS